MQSSQLVAVALFAAVITVTAVPWNKRYYNSFSSSEENLSDGYIGGQGGLNGYPTVYPGQNRNVYGIWGLKNYWYLNRNWYPNGNEYPTGNQFPTDNQFPSTKQYPSGNQHPDLNQPSNGNQNPGHQNNGYGEPSYRENRQ